MKNLFALALCLFTATTACVDDTQPITTRYDRTTHTATVSIGTEVVEVTTLPKPPADDPNPELRCVWGDYSECGWAWEPDHGGTVCCWW